MPCTSYNEQYVPLTKEQVEVNYKKAIERREKFYMELENSSHWSEMKEAMIEGLFKGSVANMLCEVLTQHEDREENSVINLPEDIELWWTIHKRQDKGDWSLSGKEFIALQELINNRKIVK